VKTRLLIETMSSGEQAEILLRGTEPIENVPGSIKELGHNILDVGKIDDMDGSKPPSYETDDVRVVIRKA